MDLLLFLKYFSIFAVGFILGRISIAIQYEVQKKGMKPRKKD